MWLQKNNFLLLVIFIKSGKELISCVWTIMGHCTTRNMKTKSPLESNVCYETLSHKDALYKLYLSLHLNMIWFVFGDCGKFNFTSKQNYSQVGLFIIMSCLVGQFERYLWLPKSLQSTKVLRAGLLVNRVFWPSISKLHSLLSFKLQILWNSPFDAPSSGKTWWQW